MPSESKPLLAAQTEKPVHYTYLKEFRVDQCPLFLQHKCTQHRPFTCFHWHFMNQRRRRPMRRRDGTFNYSPDVYCSKYDETTGICPDGDECPYLHRTAGDTERRYHLRYYKTCMCVHDTDSRGYCVKNGPHCAFAHGSHDLRPPVYDIRELQVLENSEGDGGSSNGPNILDKERNLMNEDPKWQDTHYVLANYKTEPCKKPPRLCRQGYACPQYHNSRDRRRSPKKFKYRSTPCPNVKHGDEWGEPANCENGDTCQYCHTRTEQQFHPEIYKSTKCNDVQQTGYCPRSVFCAFAHVEQEMTIARDAANPLDSGTNLADILSNALPPEPLKSKEKKESNVETKDDVLDDYLAGTTSSTPNSLEDCFGSSLVAPIAKPQCQTLSHPISIATSNAHSNYQRAPGSEREDREMNLRKHLLGLDSDTLLDPLEKVRRKSLYMTQTARNSSLPSSFSAVSPLAPPFYPPSETVESVVGNALEDLSLDDHLNVAVSIDKNLESQVSRSLRNTLGSDLDGSGLLGSSAPVNIPGSAFNDRNPLGNISPSTSSPLHAVPGGFLASSSFTCQDNNVDPAAESYLSQPISNSGPKVGSFPSAGFFDFPAQQNMSPSTCGTLNSFGTMSPSMGSSSMSEQIQRLRQELSANRVKLASWEEGIAQARSACEMWKRETDEANRKANEIEQQKKEAIAERNALQREVEQLQGGPFVHSLRRCSELKYLPLPILKTLENQLKSDLDKIQQILYLQTASKCMVCEEDNRSVVVLPCNHYVLCDSCSSVCKDCPYCGTPIVSKSGIVMPL